MFHSMLRNREMSYLVTFEIVGASGRPVSFASEVKISGQLCVGLFSRGQLYDAIMGSSVFGH